MKAAFDHHLPILIGKLEIARVIEWGWRKLREVKIKSLTMLSPCASFVLKSKVVSAPRMIVSAV